MLGIGRIDAPLHVMCITTHTYTITLDEPPTLPSPPTHPTSHTNTNETRYSEAPWRAIGSMIAPEELFGSATPTSTSVASISAPVPLLPDSDLPNSGSRNRENRWGQLYDVDYGKLDVAPAHMCRCRCCGGTNAFSTAGLVKKNTCTCTSSDSELSKVRCLSGVPNDVALPSRASPSTMTPCPRVSAGPAEATSTTSPPPALAFALPATASTAPPPVTTPSPVRMVSSGVGALGVGCEEMLGASTGDGTGTGAADASTAGRAAGTAAAGDFVRSSAMLLPYTLTTLRVQ